MQLMPQVLAVYQFHDDPERLAFNDQIEDADDIRMVDREQD